MTALNRDPVTVSALLATCFQSDFLFGVFSDPEDGGDMLLRNVC
jgi:hypothetical protein